MTATSYTVLCVDDDRDDLLDITTALQQANPALHTVVAYNGLEALEYLRKAKVSGNLPRLIITDINMPLMDGKQTITALKADPQLAKIPVVVFSTSTSGVDKAFFSRFGVPMATKPYHYRDIIRVVQTMLKAVVINER